jgi:hypothetical protein
MKLVQAFPATETAIKAANRSCFFIILVFYLE